MNKKVVFFVVLCSVVIGLIIVAGNAHGQEESPDTEEDAFCLSTGGVDGASYEWTASERYFPMHRFDPVTQRYYEQVGWYYQHQCLLTMFSAVIFDPGLQVVTGSSYVNWLRVNNQVILSSSPGEAFLGTEFAFLTIGSRSGWEGASQSYLYPGSTLLVMGTYRDANGNIRTARGYATPTATKLINFSVDEWKPLYSVVGLVCSSVLLLLLVGIVMFIREWRGSEEGKEYYD